MKSVLRKSAQFMGGAIFTLCLFSQLAFNTRDTSRDTYQWYTPVIPTQINFAGENVPIERWDVKERFDRELLFNFYNQANVLFILKLAHRYFPLIEQRLKANGVPDDFKYLCIAESNLLSNAVSRSGATGFWQFMDGTAPGYGLVVNSQVDQRSDMIKSTDAASEYLKRAYQKFGNWTAAAASYNCGQAGYANQAEFQQTKNYYDLHLPEETNRYIFRILTFKHLVQNSEALGFNLKDEEKYQPIDYKTVTVYNSIPNLAQFAINNGTTYKMLRLMNPWIKGKSLTVAGGKSFEIKLPK